MESLLILGVALVGAVGAVAFWIGDRRRRAAVGVTGPRPCPSIGEALGRVPPSGHVLAVFLSADPAGERLSEALAGDAALVRLLGRPGLEHAILRADRDGAEVVARLLEKYAGEAAAAGATTALLLDAEAGLRAVLPADPAALARELGARIAPGGDALVAKE